MSVLNVVSLKEKKNVFHRDAVGFFTLASLQNGAYVTSPDNSIEAVFREKKNVPAISFPSTEMY